MIDRLWMIFATCLNMYYAFLAIDYVAIVCVILYTISDLVAKIYVDVYNNHYMADVYQVIVHLIATYTNYRIGYWVANMQK